MAAGFPSGSDDLAMNKDRAQQKNEGAPKRVTQRFEIDLSDCKNELGYADINFKTLVEQREAEQGANKPVKNETGESSQIKSDSLGDYGHQVRLQKALPKRRLEDLLDGGEGYDLNDTIIDDSEVYEEALPDYLTTALGGHYVNTGPLKLKRVEDEVSTIEEKNFDMEKVKDTDDGTAKLMAEVGSLIQSVDGDIMPKAGGTGEFVTSGGPKVVPSSMHQHPWKKMPTSPLAIIQKKKKLAIEGLAKNESKGVTRKRIQLDPAKRLASIMETIESVVEASRQEFEAANQVKMDPPDPAILEALKLTPSGSGPAPPPAKPTISSGPAMTAASNMAISPTLAIAEGIEGVVIASRQSQASTNEVNK